MPADIDVAAVAALVADATRATMLLALSDGRALTAGELARRARITPSTASGHLTRLVEGGMLAMVRQGRHHYYRIADPAVFQVLQALAVIAPVAPARTLRESGTLKAVQRARTCYLHLAGMVGVALTDGLVAGGILAEVEDGYVVTEAGTDRLAAFGLDLAPLIRHGRLFAPHHLDWSERRYHLAGALGAVLMRRLLELGWVRRAAGSRAVHVTDEGRDGLREWFGVTVA